MVRLQPIEQGWSGAGESAGCIEGMGAGRLPLVGVSELGGFGGLLGGSGLRLGEADDDRVAGRSVLLPLCQGTRRRWCARKSAGHRWISACGGGWSL